MSKLKNPKKSKNNINCIVIIIAILIIISFAVPFILEIALFRNNIQSILDNSAWAGFLGSYIGGIFGGIGTLIAVYITTNQTQKIQTETLEQMQKDRYLSARNERIRFANEISEIIARYLAEFNEQFDNIRTFNSSLGKLNKANDELNKLQNAIYNCDIEDLKAIDKLRIQEKNTYAEIGEIKSLMERCFLYSKNTILNECRFLLYIKLSNINKNQHEATDVLNKVDEIYNLLNTLNIKPNVNLADILEKKENVIKNLQKATEVYINVYVNA